MAPAGGEQRPRSTVALGIDLTRRREGSDCLVGAARVLPELAEPIPGDVGTLYRGKLRYELFCGGKCCRGVARLAQRPHLEEQSLVTAWPGGVALSERGERESGGLRLLEFHQRRRVEEERLGLLVAGECGRGRGEQRMHLRPFSIGGEGGRFAKQPRRTLRRLRIGGDEVVVGLRGVNMLPEAEE